MKGMISILCTLVLFNFCKDQSKNKEEEVIITILQTGDIHSYLNPHEELFVENGSVVFRKAGGLAHIKTLVEKVRNENPGGTLFVDGGDLIQGSGESVLSQGKIFPPLIREMNYDVLIPGNWEVIYGKKAMLDVMNAYDTHVIVANMFDEASENPLFPQYWITEKKGIKIGFIGYNDPQVPERQNPAYSKGIKFTEVEENLKELISKLKQQEKVNILFLLTHIGISKQTLLADNPDVEGVDFILGNDTHERIRRPIEGKYAKVVEPGAFGSFVAKLELKIRDKKVAGYQYDLIEVDPQKFPADVKMKNLVDSALDPFKKDIQQVFGYTSVPIYRYLVVENPMDNLITDALLWKTGADLATSNGFRFGVPIIPGINGKKEIIKEDIWRMLPVNEHLKIGKVTGLQIKNWLEEQINNVFSANRQERFDGWLVRFSGMTIKFNSSGENGNRVLETFIGQRPLDLKKTYTMASCNRTGEPLETMCRLQNASDVIIQGYTIHEAVEEYLKAKGTVSPKIDGRAIAVDLGTNAFSQLKGTSYQFR